ncbi:Protein Aster-B [Desmophyllum pertusum]|uniref:Protein Aster-B n=1 Tax=Desmophyllum pertusum TaxID=174260 RepID=A0A9X0A1F5_9CNID|nr:Protein Aster-B [Desmophyllum pertusum]
MYVVQAEVNNEGIPYGESFSVTNRYCITRTSNMTSRLRISAEVTYHKSVWGFVRNMIEKNALEGLEGYFKFLAESLRRETTEGHWPKKRKTSPTRRHKRNRSLKNKEVMEPAVEVSNEVKPGLLQRLSPKEAISRLVGVRSFLPQVTVKNPLAVLVTVLLGVLLLLNVVLVYRLLFTRARNSIRNILGRRYQGPSSRCQAVDQTTPTTETCTGNGDEKMARCPCIFHTAYESGPTVPGHVTEELGREQTTTAAEAT